MALRKLPIACGVSLLALFAGPAFGQGAPSATPPEDQGRSGIQDIVVTAQRREESLQSVPIAVSAFTAQELANRQVTRTLDLIAYVPNLVGHNNTALGTANAYTLRGLGNTESIATFDPPVGTYVDDVFLARQGANNFQFFDVERVEVLRGPQGTLFGRNTTGGAINVILRKPGNEYGGFFDFGFGRFNRTEARVTLDVPVINEMLLTKMSAYYTRANGYVENQTTGERLNGERNYGFRGAVRVAPSENLTWDVSADYISASGSNLVNFYDATNDRRIDFTRLRTDQPIGPALLSPQLAPLTLGNLAQSWSIISNIGFELGSSANVNVITGYRHLRQRYVTDSVDSRSPASVVYNDFNYISSSPGTTTILANDSTHKQFSQEVKITGDAYDKLISYVAGVYYFKEDNRTVFANVNVPLVATPTVTQDRTVDNSTEAYAGYAQFDVKPFSALTLTAGIRYTDEFKDIFFAPNPNPLPRSGALNQPFNTSNVIAAGIPVTQRAKVWTPRLAVNYEIANEIRLFASFTKGFKSGGWNARANYAALAVPFTRETVYSYETGLRSEFLDRRVRVNLTGFYYIAKDFQLPAGYLDPVTQTIIYLTRNFADVRNYGLEGDVTVVPVDNLNVYWSFGLQRARYQNVNQAVFQQIARCLGGTVANNCNAGIVTPTGGIAVPVRVPRFASTLGANYKVPITESLSVTPSVTWQYTDGSWVATSNDPRGFQNAHSIFNAGLSLRDEDGGLTVGVDCNNCFNKVYKTSFLIYPYLSEPGRWAVRLRKDF